MQKERIYERHMKKGGESRKININSKQSLMVVQQNEKGEYGVQTRRIDLTRTDKVEMPHQEQIS